MKLLLPIGLVLATVCHSTVSAELSEQALAIKIAEEVTKLEVTPNEFDFTGKNILCESCQLYFKIVKKVIGNAGNITKETLTAVLNLTCKFLPKKIPFVKQVCEKLGPDLIDLIWKYIHEIDKEIDPLHDCQLIFLCPLDPRSTDLPSTVPTEEPCTTTAALPTTTTTDVEPEPVTSP